MHNSHSSDPISIVFVFDEKYCKFAKVTAYSIAVNTSSPLAFYVVDCGMTEPSRKALRQFLSSLPNVTAVHIQQPERISAIENFPFPSWFSSAVFYRLAIPKIFPELKRCIYMDCDVIVNGDIKQLFDEDLQGRPFGAVEEEGHFFDSASQQKRKQKIGMSPEKRYFNSGVLLIDCPTFEQHQVFERVIQTITKTTCHFSCPEQDAMNVCLASDEHFPLSPRYNFCFCTPLAKPCLKMNPSPLIIHFSWTKPWLLHKKIVQWCHRIHLARFTFDFVLLYWQYADKISLTEYSSTDKIFSLKFVYKRLFQPVERFFAKGIRNKLLSFFKKDQTSRSIKKP